MASLHQRARLQAEPRRTRRARRPSTAAFPPVTLVRLALLWVLLSALTGCLLISGEQTTLDLADGGGNLLTTFVSAEGSEERVVETGRPDAELQVIAVVEVASGDLQLSLLQPDGAVAFAVGARPATQVTRSAGVRTDAEGRLRFRVQAQGARDGQYQLFVQP
jgi:hypothetical protein